MADQKWAQHIDQNIDPVAAAPWWKVPPHLTHAPATVVGLDADQEIVARRYDAERCDDGGDKGRHHKGNAQTLDAFWAARCAGHFTAPTVRPGEMAPWIGRKSKNTGRVVTTETAMTAPQSTLSSPK